jgi:hypothetical protein
LKGVIFILSFANYSKIESKCAIKAAFFAYFLIREKVRSAFSAAIPLNRKPRAPACAKEFQFLDKSGKPFVF